MTYAMILLLYGSFLFGGNCCGKAPQPPVVVEEKKESVEPLRNTLVSLERPKSTPITVTQQPHRQWTIPPQKIFYRHARYSSLYGGVSKKTVYLHERSVI